MIEENDKKEEITNMLKASENNNNNTVQEINIDNILVKDVVQLSKQLNNSTIFLKGEFDVITNGCSAFIVNEQGSLKRCGGQGDILTGLISVYSFWASTSKVEFFNDNDKLLLGSILASLVVRRAAKKAFDIQKISLTTPSIIEQIGNSFNELFIYNNLTRSYHSSKF